MSHLSADGNDAKLELAVTLIARRIKLMNGEYPIPMASEERLLMRLKHAIETKQRVTFLFGSGLTCPSVNGLEKGVPSANTMIERVRALFTTPEESTLLDQTLDAMPQGRKYQAAMQFIIECRGQSTLNSLIRDAVLESRLTPANVLSLEDFDLDVNGWYLRPGVEALGKLIRNYEQVFRRPILTSNFDPLIEIAIRRAGRGALTINLPNDGNFSGLVLNDNIAQIVHFHGYWNQGDTLHTPDRLTRERPLLAGNLRRLLQETVLVVIGYGGWRDVFTDALLKAVSEQANGLDVLWAFYSKETKEIMERYPDLLDRFQSLPGQRIVAYAGVDCHVLFPKLLKSLEGLVAAEIISCRPTEATARAPMAMGSTSNPPATEAWVGRETELNNLLQSSWSVVALNGLGGFGKSSLAERYVAERERRRDIRAWYWADCREQGNTLQTHLINVLEYVTQGAITAASLAKATDQDILDLFFQRISSHRLLIVFDNIDHYVDLETQKAIGLMNLLIERAITTEHNAQILFTSRPIINYSSLRFLSLSVSGLVVEDIEKLFFMRGAELEAARKYDQISAVLRITQGSALHLNLIAMQIAKQKVPLDELLQRIENGTAPEAEDRILSEIWITLKHDQQDILRFLAELPHPESEQRVGACVSTAMNFNRFGRALRSLKSLNLVVVKQRAMEVEGIELHPLVRAFIRKRYPKEEQAPIVDQVISFFSRMIGRFRDRPEAGTIAVLGNWIAKIEICIENGRTVEAMETLHDIQPKLLSLGFIEEFIRLASLVVENYQVSDNPAELKTFDSVADNFADVLGGLGRYTEADQLIDKLSKTVVGKSARYIWLCDVRAFAYWIRDRFEEAKSWASEGVRLKSASKIDTQYDCAHHLALAQRDSGEVGAALSYFLNGEKLAEVVSVTHFDHSRGGTFYGNIGRCLQLMGQLDDSLVCLRKSASLLEKKDANYILMNRGWAAMWLGEVLQKKGLNDNAYLAFRSAVAKWKSVSPGRARGALQVANSLVAVLADSSLAKCGDWECEELYHNWLGI